MQELSGKDVREVTPIEAVRFAETHFSTVPEYAFGFLTDWAHHRDLSPWIDIVREVRMEAETS